MEGKTSEHLTFQALPTHFIRAPKVQGIFSFFDLKGRKTINDGHVCRIGVQLPSQADTTLPCSRFVLALIFISLQLFSHEESLSSKSVQGSVLRVLLGEKERVLTNSIAAGTARRLLGFSIFSPSPPEEQGEEVNGSL